MGREQMVIRIKKGLDIPIAGEPEQKIEKGRAVTSVATVGLDFPGLRPTMVVKEGDRVKQGDPLFVDKRDERIKFTAPASGTVRAIHRGPRRILQAVEIELESEEGRTFKSYSPRELESLSREAVQENLLESGLWTTLRTRPFGKVPLPDTPPNSIFITAMDTYPLAPNPEVVIAERKEDFINGVRVLSRLTEGKVFVCQPEGTLEIPRVEGERIEHVAFSGPHPAGLPGTHIHFLDPIVGHKVVWYINYQAVLAVGALFTTGQLRLEKVISLAGPVVKNPRLLQTCWGANIEELCEGEIETKGPVRIISGSVLHGRRVDDRWNRYLGHFHLQISALEEPTEPELLGWIDPNPKGHKFSILNLFWPKPEGPRRMQTALFGSDRPIVPIGIYEKVMPLDILPTPLLRALVIGDTEMAINLGCLELEEEDVALLTFVDPGKHNFGPVLRRNLERIEKEG